MNDMKFIGKVSKGSVFNQIYVPKDLRLEFEAGSSVEVRLIGKKLYYSKSFSVSEFKERLIKETFSFLGSFGIKQVVIAGSFIREKVDYRDIDLLLVVSKRDEKFENFVYESLIEKFNLKFHLLFVEEESFIKLQESCPLIRSLLFYSISDKEIKKKTRKMDEKHIKFLLMMPEDLLKIKAGSRVFYDSLRRLIIIEKFLSGKDENPEDANKELKMLGMLYEEIRDNESISEVDIRLLRKMMKDKLRKIEGIIKNAENF